MDKNIHKPNFVVNKSIWLKYKYTSEAEDILKPFIKLLKLLGSDLVATNLMHPLSLASSFHLSFHHQVCSTDLLCCIIFNKHWYKQNSSHHRYSHFTQHTTADKIKETFFPMNSSLCLARQSTHWANFCTNCTEMKVKFIILSEADEKSKQIYFWFPKILEYGNLSGGLCCELNFQQPLRIDKSHLCLKLSANRF